MDIGTFLQEVVCVADSEVGSIQYPLNLLKLAIS